MKFNDFLTFSFSWATIFLPFIFLSFAFMLSKIKIPLSQPNVVVGSLLSKELARKPKLDAKIARDAAIEFLERYFFETTGRRPMILPVVVEV